MRAVEVKGKVSAESFSDLKRFHSLFLLLIRALPLGVDEQQSTVCLPLLADCLFLLEVKQIHSLFIRTIAPPLPMREMCHPALKKRLTRSDLKYFIIDVPGVLSRE